MGLNCSIAVEKYKTNQKNNYSIFVKLVEFSQQCDNTTNVRYLIEEKGRGDCYVEVIA